MGLLFWGISTLRHTQVTFKSRLAGYRTLLVEGLVCQGFFGRERVED